MKMKKKKTTNILDTSSQSSSVQSDPAPILQLADENIHRVESNDKEWDRSLNLRNGFEYAYLYFEFRDNPPDDISDFFGMDTVQIIQEFLSLFEKDINRKILLKLYNASYNYLYENAVDMDNWDSVIAKNKEPYLRSGTTIEERLGANIKVASRIPYFIKYLKLLAHACSHMSSDRCISDHLLSLFSNNRYVARYRLLQCAKIPKDVGEVLAGFIREKCTTTKQASFSRTETNKINEDFDKRFPNKGDYKIQNLRITIPEGSQSKQIGDIGIELKWDEENVTKFLGEKNAIMFLALIDNYFMKSEVGLSSVSVAKLYERYGMHLADDKMDKDTQTTISHLGKTGGALTKFDDLFILQVGKMDWRLKFKKRVTIHCDRNLLKMMVGPRTFKTSH